MANKIIKVPVEDVQGLQSDGSYQLRYRIKSKDGLRKSEWSELANLSYPLNSTGQVASFYETYLPSTTFFGRPILADAIGGVDPHPTNAYDVATVSTSIDAGLYIASSITSSQEDTGIYTLSWTFPASIEVNKTFDIYLSWKYTATGWSDWQYSGTTDASNFSFSKPASNAQYVQAAIFLSSNPKLTNIFGEQAEITFVSISPAYSTYYDASATVAVQTGTSPGPYKATITNLANVPATSVISGRRVFVDGGLLGTGAVTVVSTSGGNSMIVRSENNINTTGGNVTVSNLRL